MPILRRCALGLCLCIPVWTNAQTYFAGFNLGTGRFLEPAYAKTYFNPSSAFGLNLLMRLTERTMCSFDFCFYRFGIDKKKYLAAPLNIAGEPVSVTGDLNVDVISLGLAAFPVSIESPISACALAGMGYYKLNPRNNYLVSRITHPGENATSDTTVLVDLGDTRNRPAVYVGAAFNLRFTEKMVLYVEGRYHWIFARDQKDPATGEKVTDPMRFWAPSAGFRLAL